MANNITLNAGSGGVDLATDEQSGGEHVQKIKPTFGLDASDVTVVAAASGQGLPVQGEAAENAAVTGNPVQVGGRYDATPRTLGDGDVGGIALDPDGAVHIADGGNVISVDDGAGSLTVDSADLATLAGAVSGTEMQVDVLTLPASTNTIEVVGDAAENAAAAGNPVQVGGRYDATPRTLNDGDVGGIALAADGAVHVDDGGNSLTVDGTVTANAGTGTFNVDLDSLNGTAIDVGAGTAGSGTQRVVIASNQGALDVSGATVTVDLGANNDVALNAGTNLVGDVGISGARTSGGTTIFRSIDLDETEEEIKATGGQVYWIHAMNLAASARYLKFYNATAATVVVGTTTPVLTFPLATQGDTNGAGFTLAIPNGIAFGTAITVAATTGIADADTGAPGANEVVVNIGYA